MARWLIPLITICVPPVLFAPSSHWAVIGFVGLLWGGFIAAVLKIAAWTAWRSKRRILLADCDYEHWHATWGDRRVATHGRYQP